MSVAQALAKISQVQTLRRAKARADADRARAVAAENEPDPVDLAKLSTLEFVPLLNPGYDEPTWFAPYGEILDTAAGEGHELVFAAPPQHGKTVVTAAGLIRCMIRRSELRNGYATYNTDRARSVARDVRRLAQGIGLELTGEVMAPRTTANGGIFFVGRGGAATGEKINGFGVVDDPFKDPKEANSPAIRDAADEWYTKVWDTRIHPGASKIVMATRWHADDLSGRLVKRDGYRYLNIPAIAQTGDPLGREPGEALSPHWPIEVLRKRLRKDAHAFWAMYQGDPKVDGQGIFHDPNYYDSLPPMAFKVGIGVDLAFTAKTSSDFSVIVVIYAVDVPTDDGVTRIYYITEVHRMQKSMPEFVSVLGSVLKRHPGVRARWYRGGFENGVAPLVNELLKDLKDANDKPMNLGRNRLEDIVVNQDKVVRSHSIAKSWNAGAVLVPLHGIWVSPFLEEVGLFSGIGDDFDDQVDAAAAAHDSVGASCADEYESMTEESDW